MVQGVIIKALSGFYYVAAGDQIVEWRAAASGTTGAARWSATGCS